MKVAVLIDTWFPFMGGGQINALEVSKRLAKKGIQIEIITRNNGIYNNNYTKALRVIKLGQKSAPDNSIARYIYLANSFFYVYRRHFDLVHSHAFLPGIVARILMATKGIPAIFTVHGTSIDSKLNGLLSRMIENFILTKILYSAEITVSRDFLRLNNVNKKIEFIPNGVDHLNIKPKRIFRKSQIVCVARLHPQKNLANLIEAFKMIIKDFGNFNLIIAGDGPQKSELLATIKRLKLKNTVHLVGEVDKAKLRQLYKESKLFTLPSIYEGQSLSILEAMRSGLPVVVSKVGDNPFFIKDFVNGFLIDDPLNPKSIAQGIKKALMDKNLTKVAEKGRETVVNVFTWENVANKTVDLYEEVVKSKN